MTQFAFVDPCPNCGERSLRDDGSCVCGYDDNSAGLAMVAVVAGLGMALVLIVTGAYYAWTWIAGSAER